MSYPVTVNSEEFLDSISQLYSDMLDSMNNHAEALAAQHSLNAFELNALAHAEQSARLELLLPDAVVQALGELKELQSDPGHGLDSLKDAYNNEVGRRIAQFIKLNGLDANRGSSN